MTDINECESEDVCMYGTCVNKPGGYECRCDQDHQLIPSGTGCVGQSTTVITAIVKVTSTRTAPIHKHL